MPENIKRPRATSLPTNTTINPNTTIKKNVRIRSRSANEKPQENPLKREMISEMIIIKDRVATVESMLRNVPIKVNSFFKKSANYATKFRNQFEILKIAYNDFILTMNADKKTKMINAMDQFLGKIIKYRSVIQCTDENATIVRQQSAENIIRMQERVREKKHNPSAENIAGTKSYVCSAIDDIIATATKVKILLQQ